MVPAPWIVVLAPAPVLKVPAAKGASTLSTPTFVCRALLNPGVSMDPVPATLMPPAPDVKAMFLLAALVTTSLIATVLALVLKALLAPGASKATSLTPKAPLMVLAPAPECRSFQIPRRPTDAGLVCSPGLDSVKTGTWVCGDLAVSRATSKALVPTAFVSSCALFVPVASMISGVVYIMAASVAMRPCWISAWWWRARFSLMSFAAKPAGSQKSEAAGTAAAGSQLAA
eukprot:13430337-Heterocapsa_arctica.AAC.1